MIGVQKASLNYMFGVQKALLNNFWEYSPSLANLASYWLRAKELSCCGEERTIKMDDGVDTSLTSEGNDLFVDLWDVQPCLADPERYSIS